MTSRPSVGGRAAPALRVAGCLLASLAVQWAWVRTARGQGVDGPGHGARAARERGDRVLTGRVLVGDRPADTGTVVLHRVSGDSSGEVDSVGVGPGGFFELTLPAGPGTGDEVFFATVRHQDVLYFGQALTGPADPGGDYVIQAYPALPAGADARPLLRVRNVFATRPESGRGWSVADFFELRNGVPATLVSGEAGSTWSHALPREAVDPRAGESDLAPGMASFRDGRVHVSAPIPPGESVYLVRYDIPEDDFGIPLEVAVGSMELLVRESAGNLSVTGLAAVGEVDVEGVRYRRFTGRDLAPSVVAVTAGATRTPFGSPSLVAVFLTLLFAGAGALLAARSGNAAGGPGPGRRRRVLVEIARLDEEWEAGELPADDYGSRRTRLLEKLRP